MGRHQRRFHNPHTYPCQLLLFRFLLIWRMPDTRLRRFRKRYIFLYQQLLPNFSLHNNGFGWTDIYTCLAVNAHFLVDFRLFVLNGNSWRGALIHACLASGTSAYVNNCNQLVHSSVYVGGKMKNRFRYTHLWKTYQSCFLLATAFKMEHKKIILNAGVLPDRISAYYI